MNAPHPHPTLPDCHGRPEVCRFLETEGRSALLGYFRKRAPWDAAEDLAHDAFLKAWTRCDGLQEPGQARSWLFTIAHNRLVDHYRRSASKKSHLEALAPDQPGNRESEADAFREDMASLLQENLELLPDEQQPIVAALLSGERQIDIARRLNLPLSTVKSRTQRARKRILAYASDQCRFHRDAFGRVIDCDPKTADCCAQ